MDVWCEDVEGVVDLPLCHTTPHIKEVGRRPSMQLDQIHCGHRQARPIHCPDNQQLIIFKILIQLILQTKSHSLRSNKLAPHAAKISYTHRCFLVISPLGQRQARVQPRVLSTTLSIFVIFCFNLTLIRTLVFLSSWMSAKWPKFSTLYNNNLFYFKYHMSHTRYNFGDPGHHVKSLGNTG